MQLGYSRGIAKPLSESLAGNGFLRIFTSKKVKK